MTIPEKIVSDLTFFIASVKAAAPLAQATQITLSALQNAGQAIVSEIEAALAGAGAPLDAGDPTCAAADLPAVLLGLAMASEEQAALSDALGLVGRALFNIAQAAAA